jgi:phosphate transport system substrate-binding protein
VRTTTHRRARALLATVALVTVGLIAAGCGDDSGNGGSGSGGDGDQKLSGSIRTDGSSTVAPLTKVAAEDFQAENSGVTVTVGTSGTGGGFEKFCNGETDISNASRQIKEDDEKEGANCKKNGIEWFELLIANDGLTVVVNKDNDWAKCLTVEQLKKMWEPAAEKTITNWNQIDPSFPDQKLSLYGAGTDSGTFDYFTKAIVGEEGSSRTDYQPSEDDNVTVTGVSGEKGALGYFGFSYFEENADKVKAVEIDNGNGCVAPSVETVQDGSYAPLSRPLFLYVSSKAAVRPEVKAFVKFYLDNIDTITKEALFVTLTDEQKATAEAELEAIEKA